jgi:sugar phosphate permease
VLGSGLGLSTAPVQTAAIETVPLAQAGQAAGLFSTMRYLGGIIGSSFMAAVLSAPAPPIGSFRVLYAALVFSAFGATITAWHLPVWTRRAGGRKTELPGHQKDDKRV